MCKSVDFPDPDGPMIETNSPLAIEKVTPRRACVGVSSSRYSFLRLFTSIMESSTQCSRLVHFPLRQRRPQHFLLHPAHQALPESLSSYYFRLLSQRILD